MIVETRQGRMGLGCGECGVKDGFEEGLAGILDGLGDALTEQEILATYAATVAQGGTSTGVYTTDAGGNVVPVAGTGAASLPSSTVQSLANAAVPVANNPSTVNPVTLVPIVPTQSQQQNQTTQPTGTTSVPIPVVASGIPSSYLLYGGLVILGLALFMGGGEK